jgi:hypothetical protein
MKLATKWIPFQSLNDFAASRDELADKWGETVRTARLEIARDRQDWTEIPEARLIRRGPFLVDAETDLLYTVVNGEVFEFRAVAP